MNYYLTICYFLQIFLSGVQISLQVCPYGFFGEKCDMICRCSSGCSSSGDCINNGVCHYHFFGPACQYVDMVSWGVVNTPKFIHDWNDRTCNGDVAATAVELTLDRATPFTWYRIIVNDQNAWDNFNTTFNTNDICWNEKHYRLSNVTMDVNCDTQVLLTTLRIFGTVAPYICTVYVSAGRYVSYKQLGWQSSTKNNDQWRYGPYHALDMKDDTCSYTDVETKGPSWSVTLARPARISLINIYNPENKRWLLRRASLDLVDSNLNTVGRRYLVGDNNFEKVVSPTHLPVLKLLLSRAADFPVSSRWLSLCTFEAFGDQICPDHMYGVVCESVCLCNKTEACSFITGACAPGCFTGAYGYNCSLRCSEHCVPDTCNFFSGSCSPCEEYYFGDKCDETCLPGTYGLSLPCKNCSVGCNNTCDQITGDCNCTEGYVGQRCDECTTGNYKAELSCVECSVGCTDICNITNGHCTCHIEYAGSRCSECRNGSFGPNCEYVCSAGCADVCHNTDGYCSCRSNFVGALCADCLEGYYGPDCQSQCSDGCNETCDGVDGRCACEPGFKGYRCAECLRGQFGALCMSNCSKGCRGGCQKVDGRCTCRRNYVGSFCTACRKYAYGPDCQHNCSIGCDIRCNITGNCPCKKYFIGDKCAECVHPRYGRRCDMHCSKTCLNQSCARMTGKCSACIDGHKGAKCVLDTVSYIEWLTILPFLACWFLLFFCGRRATDDESDHGEK